MIPGERKPNNGGYVRSKANVAGQVRFEARFRGRYLGTYDQRSDAEDRIAEEKALEALS